MPLFPNNRLYRVYFDGERSALFMVGFVFSCCLTGRGKGDFGDESITLIGSV